MQRMICIPILSDTAIEDIKKANKIADIIELRLDLISKPDIKKLIESAEKPVIVTNRAKNNKLESLKKAADLGADYVDIEIDADYKQVIENKKDSKVIVSYHNFDETPSNLDEICNNLVSTDADIIKIATKANKLSDNLRILKLIKKSKKPIIAMCMGQLGEISRILAPLYGSYLTFASLEKGKESAEGQIPAETLRGIYRINEIKPGFKIYGIVGNPVNKSKGYLIHNALFKKHKINSIYLNFLVDDLEDFIKNFSGMLEGLSVTMPHKQNIMKHLDELDPIAEKIGAVNTVVKKDNKLIGYNTDMTGAIKAIKEKTEIKDKNITILGAGGTSRAIAVGIIEESGKLTILNRTVEKAEKLSKELDCNFGPLSDFQNIKTDILINTTSVGMRPDTDTAPVNTGAIKNMLVFDVIYNPKKTKLLKEAEKNNCTIISGKEMFINQAAEQFRLLAGKEPDTNLLRGILK